ncbi:hypothetical protein BD289DRAFT_366386 [Coniella lustricola]|uniref:Rhodopsin domain-containing protein n=1 Tax=Coniella lustricola TaxID=2025994 RepID=A0A2T3AAY7_9PEZI|nr:hypothetical protein BD289DRAFT_366386 [Coniella lustricola]
MGAETRGPQIAAVTWTLMFMSTVATALRIYCRGWIIKAFGMDDWLAVGSQILFIVFCSYEITGVKYGTGQHNADLPADSVPQAMHMWWTCEPLYVLTNMMIKASIAIFLMRICVHRMHTLVIWITIGVTELYSLFFFLLFVLQCRPTSLFWLRYSDNAPDGTCLDASVVSDCFYGYSAISCWTDWTYSILPIFLVWNLQMSKRIKVSVVLILAAGVIASSATIVRFPYLHTLTEVDDFLFATADVAIWSTVETGIGITASAVATLRPLLRSFFGEGSSAPGNGTSARQWPRTGSNHPTKGATYLRSNAVDDEAFDMHDNVGKRIGVTTVIDHGGKAVNDFDLEAAKSSGDDASQASGSDGGSGGGSRMDDWNSSQSNLADQASGQQQYQNKGGSNNNNNNNNGGNNNGWNITIKKSIVHTRGVEML